VSAVEAQSGAPACSTVAAMDIPWQHGTWTNPPVSAVEQGTDLLVTAKEGSDAWRVTSYGFIHDSEHALLAPFPQDSAVEVEFTADFSEQFDQAGIFVHVSAERWVKAGVEFADGACQVGAVATDGMSDWSLAPVPAWKGSRVLVRISRSGDALTIRAKAGDGALQLVRVVPLDPAEEAQAGPFICAPARAGLAVPFHAWRTTEPDGALH
jgi:regulation of enolase protein 1 (concanavalin A-like superfamily)